jgi:hypothetical protein
MYFYEHQPMEVLILDEVVDITIKDKKIVGWTMIIKKNLIKLNLGGGGGGHLKGFKKIFFNHFI